MAIIVRAASRAFDQSYQSLVSQKPEQRSASFFRAKSYIEGRSDQSEQEKLSSNEEGSSVDLCDTQVANNNQLVPCSVTPNDNSLCTEAHACGGDATPFDMKGVQKSLDQINVPFTQPSGKNKNQPSGNIINVNAQYAQFGNNNTMNVNAKGKKRGVKATKINEEEFKSYLESDQKLENEDLQKISKSIGKKWRKVGRHLSLTDAELDNLHSDYLTDGAEETYYQMFLKWKKKFPKDCTVAYLANVFLKAERSDLIKELPEKKSTVFAGL